MYVRITTAIDQVSWMKPVDCAFVNDLSSTHWLFNYIRFPHQLIDIRNVIPSNRKLLLLIKVFWTFI